MTIGGTVNYLFEHPFFKQAILAYNRGDEKDLRFILQEVQLHTYLTVAKDCSVAYRQNKRANDPQIIEAIKDVAPPEKLDLRLPFVPKTENCKVVTLSPKVKHIKNYKDPKQLELVFETNKKTPKKFLEALVG